jgi:hypothetical protein
MYRRCEVATLQHHNISMYVHGNVRTDASTLKLATFCICFHSKVKDALESRQGQALRVPSGKSPPYRSYFPFVNLALLPYFSLWCRHEKKDQKKKKIWEGDIFSSFPLFPNHS